MKILHLESDKFSSHSLSRLRNGNEVDENPFIDQSEYTQILSRHSFDAIFTRIGLHTGEEEFNLQPNLKFLISATTGLNHIDLDAARERNIEVISLQGETGFLSSITSTAEHTWLLVLCLFRQIVPVYTNVISGKWQRTPFQIHQIYEKTLGIIGYGRLGKMIANYATAFGMQVLFYDNQNVKEINTEHRFCSFNKILKQSDIIVLMASWSDENTDMFSYKQFKLMKENSFFVNASRGEMVNESALLESLQSNHLAGAALDVLSGDSVWGDDLPENQQLVAYSKKHPHKLIITSHIGGFANEAIKKTRDFITDKFLKILQK
jgi:D-3-phosphoglycerate dehydrogenase